VLIVSVIGIAFRLSVHQGLESVALAVSGMKRTVEVSVVAEVTDDFSLRVERREESADVGAR